MPYKVLPHIVYYCDICLDVELKYVTSDRGNHTYKCPCCSKEITLSHVLPLPFKNSESILEKISVINQDDLFSLSIRNCDRFTRNYLFSLIKIGLHAARAESSLHNSKKAELATTINNLEDLLLELWTINNISYDQDNMPKIMLDKKRYSKFILKLKDGK